MPRYIVKSGFRLLGRDVTPGQEVELSERDAAAYTRQPLGWLERKPDAPPEPARPAAPVETTPPGPTTGGSGGSTETGAGASGSGPKEPKSK